MNKREMMNSKPTMLLSEFKNPERGMLIGFKGFEGKDDQISAAYQLWQVAGETIWFVLGYREGTGKPILDATHLKSTSPPYINVEPIKTDIEIATATTFGAELSRLFNG